MSPDDIALRPGETLAAWEVRMQDRYLSALKAVERPPWKARKIVLEGERE